MYALLFPQLNDETAPHWLALKVQQHCQDHFGTSHIVECRKHSLGTTLYFGNAVSHAFAEGVQGGYCAALEAVKAQLEKGL